MRFKRLELDRISSLDLARNSDAVDEANARLGAIAIRLAYGRHGKLRLAPAFPANRFNLSHSADVVLYALAPDGPELGIDVELQRPLADLDKMAARVLTGRGRAEYQALDGAAQQHAFFRHGPARKRWPRPAARA